MKTFIVAAIAALLAVAAIDLVVGSHANHRMAHGKHNYDRADSSDDVIKCSKGYGATDDDIEIVDGNDIDENDYTLVWKCVAACYAKASGFFDGKFNTKTFLDTLSPWIGEKVAKQVAADCEADLDKLDPADFCERGFTADRCLYKVLHPPEDD